MVTIREISNIVGVSSATVSRVLNMDPTLSVSEQKRKAIIETAEAMNYTTPKARREKQLGSVLMVHSLDLSRELSDPYYVGLRLGIENRCKEIGMQITPLHADQIAFKKNAIRATTGAIFVSKPIMEDWNWLEQFDGKVVFAEWAPEDARYDTVSADIYKSMYTLLNSLDEKGYKRIGYIGQSHSDNINATHEPRYAAYLDWMKTRGQYDASHCVTVPPPILEREQLGYEMMKRLCENPNRPDCVIAFNDNVAVGTYRAANELGLRISKDISIASFNDISAAQFLSPPLTTVRIPSEDIGIAAVDLLAERLRGRQTAKYVTMATEIIWRGSA